MPSDIACVHWPGIAKEAGLLRLSKRESDGALYQGRTPKYHFHALRHFGAALLIEQGISPYHLMQVMGHNDIKVTLNTYGHLFETDTTIRDKMIAGLSGFKLPQLPDRSTAISLTSKDEDGRAKVAALRAEGVVSRIFCKMDHGCGSGPLWATRSVVHRARWPASRRHAQDLLLVFP
jgi:Phage integrase family